LTDQIAAQGTAGGAFAQSGPRDANRSALGRKVRAVLAGRSRQMLSDPSLTCAAVLIPLLFREGEWCVLVTQRTQHVEHHKGQISFPGGACDPEDASLEATALREVYEEIGLPPEAVEILGALDDLQTITDFAVTPFVGVLRQPFAYRLNPAEVEAVIEVPLAFLGDPDNLRVEQLEYKGDLHEVLFWDYGPHAIWGATARILKGFVDLLAQSAIG
jgi:8-oxo-dGTP pyrophosphatase MutT (NUDIX family)